MAIENLDLIGGNLCLDFVNTVGDHLSDHPGDWLKNYDDLVTWGQRTGAVTAPEAEQLSIWAGEGLEAAEAVLAEARSRRETIFRLLLAAIRGEAPPATDLATLNRALDEFPSRSGLIYDDLHFIWQFSGEMDRLDGVLWRVVWAAADLLTSDQLAQVKICEGDDCGWMFLDTSRNRTRRWCSMADCGNRAKANRYYQRHKGE